MLGGLERDRDRDRDLIALHRRHDPITALPVAELHTGPRAAPRAPSSSGGRRRRMLAETRTQRTVSKRLPADHARGWLLEATVAGLATGLLSLPLEAEARRRAVACLLVARFSSHALTTWTDCSCSAAIASQVRWHPSDTDPRKDLRSLPRVDERA